MSHVAVTRTNLSSPYEIVCDYHNRTKNVVSDLCKVFVARRSMITQGPGDIANPVQGIAHAMIAKRSHFKLLIPNLSGVQDSQLILMAETIGTD